MEHEVLKSHIAVQMCAAQDEWKTCRWVYLHVLGGLDL